MKYELLVNGFPVQAEYDDAAKNGVFIPFLRHMAELQRCKNGRLTVFLAAPPAVGKSTLALWLQGLAAALPGMPAVQALGMDGFHYPAAYIAAHTVARNGETLPMQLVKGSPDTFDVEGLRAKLKEIQQGDALWPFYDRRLHDVVPDAVPVTAPIVLVEGNYLLLDDLAWRDLPHDYSVFIGAEEALLRDRLIARKMRGGAELRQALAHYDICDGPNVLLCLAHHLPADLTLRMVEDGKFVRE